MHEPDEIELKQRFWVSEVVNARLRDAFPAPHVSAVAVALAPLVGEDPGGDPDVSDIASARLMLAAIKVSGGDARKLALWVEVARQDPRDLIAAAEYSRALVDPSPSARRADLADYLSWVQGLDG